MPKLTYFPLMMDRWIAGTRHMTYEEKGFYLDLLIYLYEKPERYIKDEAHIARILGCRPQKVRRIWPRILGKFRRFTGGFSHSLVKDLQRNAMKVRGLQEAISPIDPDPDPEVREEKDTLSPKPPFSAKKPKAKQAYPDAFEALWITRPKRAGGDDKKRACQAWRARISEGNTQESIQAGVDRYRAYCDGTGKTGTEFVKQMATFLGPADPPHFTEDWAIPQNGNGGTNGSDYDRPIRGSYEWHAERDKRCKQERLDAEEAGEILGSDDGVVWERLEK